MTKTTNVQEVRKMARKVFGEIDTELKSLKDIYFFKGKKGAGYLIDSGRYPDVKNLSTKLVPIDGKAFILCAEPINFVQLLWLYPEIIDKYKVTMSVMPEINRRTKKMHREESLRNACAIIKEKDPQFLVKYKEAGMGIINE